MIITRNAHKLTLWLGALALAAACEKACAVDYHVATAQDLQNALTLAAVSSVSNNIYVTNGYYTGNFNYSNSTTSSLAVLAETNLTSGQVVFDGGGIGRDMSLTSTGIGSITVNGITFLRNCGNASIGALRIASGGGATILVQNCQFLTPTGSSGMGLELASGLNATVTNCTVIGSTSGSGAGISASGVTGAVVLQKCIVATNSACGNGAGINITGAGADNLTGNMFVDNTTTCAAYGGGVYCDGVATFSGNSFTGNSSGGNNGFGGAGGGAYSAGPATLTANTFTGNYSTWWGAGVYCGGAATLTGNTFSTNSTGGEATGGGAYCAVSATVTSNIFIGNSINDGNYGGGGIYCAGAATLTANSFVGNSVVGAYGGGAVCAAPATLIGNTFTGNCGAGGGGAYCCGLDANGRANLMASYSISCNIFQKNTAITGGGGGLYVAGPALTLQDNLVANNSQGSATSQGGGIWVNATSNLFMINNTIFGNTAAGSGGGAAFQVNGTVELLNVYNNIIWGNAADGNGGDVWLAGTGQKKVFEFNDVDSLYGVWDIALNNIDLSPQFFDPVNGDYHIQSTSPCANAGTNGAPSLPLTDLDGNSRTNSAGLVDMGCYEFNTTATHPADTDTNWVITAAEFNAYAAAWKNGQGWTNGPNPISADYVTRAGYLMTNNAGAYHNDGSARPVNWKTGP